MSRQDTQSPLKGLDYKLSLYTVLKSDVFPLVEARKIVEVETKLGKITKEEAEYLNTLLEIHKAPDVTAASEVENERRNSPG